MSIAPTASHIYLQRLAIEPPTILAFLCQRFPQIGEERWSSRIREGKVRKHIPEESAHKHHPMQVDVLTPYEAGIVVSYFREVEAESQIPFTEKIIFQNDHLLVVDKPHFLPVTPAGNSVNECLLYRLQRRTGIEHLAPLHRLDSDTAGLVLFSTSKATRGAYHQLFAQQKIAKIYLAVSQTSEGSNLKSPRRWLLENRISTGHPWFKMAIVAGQPNAATEIFLKELRENLALFELRPQTGKKHQLRLHLSSIGLPILNDHIYPDLLPRVSNDYSNPLQLLATKIGFVDPMTGQQVEFASNQKLDCWQDQDVPLLQEAALEDITGTSQACPIWMPGSKLVASHSFLKGHLCPARSGRETYT